MSMAQDDGRELRPSAGWAVVHLYYRIERYRWRHLDTEQRAAAVEELRNWVTQLAQEEGLQVVPQVGVTKFDFGLMVVHPDLRRVQLVRQELAATAFGACLSPVLEFLSLTEASEYITNEVDWMRLLLEKEKLDPTSPEFATRFAQLRKRTGIYAQSRIHPQLPDHYPIVCFYPMAKARRDHDNWYRLSFEDRKRLMLQHGEAGRRFADRVTQLITTCTGIDDWEWGVTLFSHDLKAIRDIVYVLRYDEASAVYGIFGSFYVGIRTPPEHLAVALRL